MAKLQIHKSVTHGWGDGADHRRLVVHAGDLVEVGAEVKEEAGKVVQITKPIADHFREKGWAAYEANVEGAAPLVDTAPVGAAPTRPPMAGGNLAAKVRGG